MRQRLKLWAEAARRDVLAVYLAARDPRVPCGAKILALAAAAYAFSPIDLIPDFIPVIGYLDDLILLPLAILLAVRLIPPEVMVQLRAEASARLASSGPPKSRVAAAVIVVVWLAILAAGGYWAFAAFRIG